MPSRPPKYLAGISTISDAWNGGKETSMTATPPSIRSMIATAIASGGTIRLIPGELIPTDQLGVVGQLLRRRCARRPDQRYLVLGFDHLVVQLLGVQACTFALRGVVLGFGFRVGGHFDSLATPVASVTYTSSTYSRARGGVSQRPWWSR